ncbi:MAG: hypothetical protein A3F11_04655 [Gammaproteobacteria bacterium RIFCSPHIGHO2_12_FULL_37_14]|nr:MAG: hypothetical protein A3F11_04655 [Gammaproteobacteria bacterium RIFCSPHIGHO2_12_FULL_37_14]
MIIITTTFDIQGYRIVEYRGIVRGLIVRSPTIVQGWMGGLKNLVGGNIGAFTKMCETARKQAFDSLIEHGKELGANAIVGMRYDASQIAAERFSATEILCYGTAVIIEQLK